MGLKDVLEKMKLVEADEPEPVAPAPRPPVGKSPPPPPQMKDVLKGVAAPRVDDAALSKAASATTGDIPDFESIYKASGVSDPKHGFSAYKVLEILSSSDFEGLDLKAKAAALSGFLKMNPAGPVPITDVVQDAVRRDQALDGFEDFLKKKLEQRQAQLDQENQKLQAEIDELMRRNKEKMDQNRAALESEKERLATWQARKRIEERRLFDAVAPFVQDNPVTLADSGAGTPKPEAS